MHLRKRTLILLATPLGICLLLWAGTCIAYFKLWAPYHLLHGSSCPKGCWQSIDIAHDDYQTALQKIRSSPDIPPEHIHPGLNNLMIEWGFQKNIRESSGRINFADDKISKMEIMYERPALLIDFIRAYGHPEQVYVRMSWASGGDYSLHVAFNYPEQGICLYGIDILFNRLFNLPLKSPSTLKNRFIGPYHQINFVDFYNPLGPVDEYLPDGCSPSNLTKKGLPPPVWNGYGSYPIVHEENDTH